MCEPVSAAFAIIIVIIYYHLLGVGEDFCFGVMLLSDGSVTQIKGPRPQLLLLLLLRCRRDSRMSESQQQRLAVAARWCRYSGVNKTHGGHTARQPKTQPITSLVAVV